MTSFQPYILGSKESELDSDQLEAKLKDAGFQVLGTVSPADGYTTVCFSHPDLKKEASDAAVPFGAVLRASLVVQTEGNKTELSYCSPHWWAYAMGLKGNSCNTLALELEKALGNEGAFGCQKGKTEAQLRNYSYAFGMPKVTDLDKLQNYASFKEAGDAVTKGIEASPDVSQVYQLDIDSATRVIGVSIQNNKGADATVLGVCDASSSPKQGGLYGPYEIVVNDGTVMTLKGRFRIAIAFPDLSMATFMKIVSAPGAIGSALKAATDQVEQS